MPDDLALTGRHIVAEIGVVLFAVGRGHQHLDVLYQHFLRVIAQNAFRSLVECGDAANPVDADHAFDDVVLGGRGRALAGDDAVDRLDAQVEQRGSTGLCRSSSAPAIEPSSRWVSSWWPVMMMIGTQVWVGIRRI